MAGSRCRRSEDIDDKDGVIEYGFQTSRRRVSYEYRNSSALSPSQLLERDVYYDAAMLFMQFAMYYFEMCSMLTRAYNLYFNILVYLSNIGDYMESFIESLHWKMQQIRSEIDRTSIIVSWMRLYSKLSFLYAEDLSIFIQIQQRNHFYPK